MKEKETYTEEKPLKKKGLSGFEKVFYFFFLPLLAITILVGMLLQYSGYDVLGKVLTYGNKVPYLEMVIPDPDKEPEEIAREREASELQRKLTNAEKLLEEKEAEIEELTQEQEKSDARLLELERTFEKIKEEAQQDRLSDEEYLAKLKEMSDLYGSMSAGKAAEILEKLTLEEASLIMAGMDNRQRQGILGKMEPDYAANLTVVMQTTELSKDSAISALQERVNTLMESLDDDSDAKSTVSLEETSKTIAKMPPQQAAALIIDMGSTSTDFFTAVKILANMDANSRSAIIANITNEDPTFAKRLINSMTDTN